MEKYDDQVPNTLEYPREYLSVQLAFAKVHSSVYNQTVEESARIATALPRRLTGGKLKTPNENEVWANLFSDPTNLEERTGEVYAANDANLWQSNPTEQGEMYNPDKRKFRTCSFDLWTDEEGDPSIVKIHFIPNARGVVGPFDSENATQRIADFNAMFTHIKNTFPNAQSVVSVTWLWNTKGYPTLFPAIFQNSVTPEMNPGLQGNSIWGQFVNRFGNAHQRRVSSFLNALQAVDPKATDAEVQLMAAFPKKVMRAQAPIENIYTHFGVE